MAGFCGNRRGYRDFRISALHCEQGNHVGGRPGIAIADLAVSIDHRSSDIDFAESQPLEKRQYAIDAGQAQVAAG